MSLIQAEPSSLVAVNDQCAAIESWASACDSVPELQDASNKLAAIDEYLTRTSTEGRARVAAAMRRLETRIGQLLGPGEPGRPTDENPNRGAGLNDRQRVEFRRMAENPDVVEDEIQRSTDDQPASRRKVQEAIRRKWEPTKPDLGGGVSHPARYSAELIEVIRVLLAEYGMPSDKVLDPFAGPGGIHELQTDGWETVGIELEPEWANLHPDTQIGDALDLPFDTETFGAIITSPTYGNRLADSHQACDPERRRSYTHDLGHDLSAGNSGTIHWRTSPPGEEAKGSLDYRTFHEKAWDEAVLVLQPGGLFILNCCDHVRDGLVQPVTAWHCWALGRLGLDYIESRSVQTRKLRQGANGSLREQEQVHVFRKPT